MKHSRSYPQVMRRWYRPVEHKCAECGRTLREVKTLSKRIVVTLTGVIKVTHAGYRCPDAQCPGSPRTYRSAAADALALPGFTYGLDIVLLVGRLHPCLAPDGRRNPRRTAGATRAPGSEDLAARDPLS